MEKWRKGKPSHEDQKALSAVEKKELRGNRVLFRAKKGRRALRDTRRGGSMVGKGPS